MMKRITAGAVAALAAAALAGQASGAPNATALTGKVGPGFTIALANSSGKKVTSLKAGSYKITVQDKSNIHDFHLTGPGVNKVITSVGFVGTKSVTITLKKGTYAFMCDPHKTLMKGSFTVS